MSREEVYQDIESTFGFVPTFLTQIPESTLDLEWQLMKRLQFDEGPIPIKYRELIGLGVSAASHCRYCTLFHTEVARLHGATDEEIEAAVHFAKLATGWSTYVNGMQIDYEQFRDEVRRAVAFARSKAEGHMHDEGVSCPACDMARAA